MPDLKLTETEINLYMDKLFGSVNRKKVLDYLEKTIIINEDGNIKVLLGLDLPYKDLVDLAELRDIKQQSIVDELGAKGFSVEDEPEEKDGKDSS